MNLIRNNKLTFILGLCFLTTSEAALAQFQMTRASGSTKSFVVSLPVSFVTPRESRIHLELNLRTLASVAIEYAAIGNTELKEEEHIAETGESQSMYGSEFTLVLARYTQPTKMAGFYWNLGAGYREVKGHWQIRPHSDDTEVNFSLTNSQGLLNHTYTGKGVTGHGRIGYRYVADSVPLLVGAYFGFRHHQLSIEDGDEKYLVNKDGDTPKTASAMTDREKRQLERQFMSSPALAVELGFAF